MPRESQQHFDHCGDKYLLSMRVQIMLKHIRFVRDWSEISRGWGCKTGGSQFFDPFKREGYKKNERKRGRVTRN